MRLQSILCLIGFVASTPAACAPTQMPNESPTNLRAATHPLEEAPALPDVEPQKTAPASKTALEILNAAEQYIGQPYVFGGRLGKRGCRRKGKPIQCRPGIDCQSLLFFAHEKVLGKRWWSYDVMPTQTVKNQEIGRPVLGLAGVLRADLDPTQLAPGDVLFFLLKDYNLQVDGPLLVDGERKYS